MRREVYGDVEQILGGIRRLRALERELESFTPDWYTALRVEARLIDELRREFGVMDVHAIDWMV